MFLNLACDIEIFFLRLADQGNAGPRNSEYPLRSCYETGDHNLRLVVLVDVNLLSSIRTFYLVY